jgi:protein-S-isoprenylcysteine O-methyltransferase Ste14
MRVRTAIQGTAFVVVAFVVLPCAFVALGEDRGWPRSAIPGGDLLGGLLVAAGVAVVLHCSRVFHAVGRGTPVPIEPPQELVVTDLYRWSRNPIYVADVAILVGLFLLHGSWALLLYAVLFAVFAHVFIVAWEEPGLARRFGEPYERYRRQAPRWLGPRARPTP